MKKIVRPGTIATWGGRRMSVYISLDTDTLEQHGRRYISVTGVEGPLPSGNALGGCGRIDMDFAHRDTSRDDARTRQLIQPSDFRFARGWTSELWLDLLDLWARLHMKGDNAAVAEAEGFFAQLPPTDRQPAWI